MKNKFLQKIWKMAMIHRPFFAPVSILLLFLVPGRASGEPDPFQTTGEERVQTAPAPSRDSWRIHLSGSGELPVAFGATNFIDPPAGKSGPFLSVSYRSDGRDGLRLEPVEPVSLTGDLLIIEGYVFGYGDAGSLYAEFLDPEKQLQRVFLTSTSHRGWSRYRVPFPVELRRKQLRFPVRMLTFRGISFLSGTAGDIRFQMTSPGFLIRPAYRVPGPEDR